MIRSSTRFHGVTRVTVLVGIAIIALLIGTLLPAVQVLREKAAFVTSQNNLKQIGVGSQRYHETFHKLAGNGTSIGTVRTSTATSSPFFYQLLPYVGERPLFESGPPTSTTTVKTYLEPYRGRSGVVGILPATDYAVNYESLYGWNPDTRTPHVPMDPANTLTWPTMRDGISNTILAGGKALPVADYFAESGDRERSFMDAASGGRSVFCARNTTGAAVPVAVTDEAATSVSDSFGGPYSRGVLFVFHDGHVVLLTHTWLTAVEKIVHDGISVHCTSNNLRRHLTPDGGDHSYFD